MQERYESIAAGRECVSSRANRMAAMDEGMTVCTQTERKGAQRNRPQAQQPAACGDRRSMK